MKYYAVVAGKQIGPVEFEELIKCDITPETYVWKPGMSEWKPAKMLSEFREVWVRKQTPPAPPVQAFSGSPASQAQTSGNTRTPVTPVKKPSRIWFPVVSMVCSITTCLLTLVTSHRAGAMYDYLRDQLESVNFYDCVNGGMEFFVYLITISGVIFTILGWLINNRMWSVKILASLMTITAVGMATIFAIDPRFFLP